MPTLGVNAATTQPYWRLPDELRAGLAARLPPGWRLEVCEQATGLGALVRASRAVVGWPFPAALARRAPELRWVHLFTSGVPEGWRDVDVELTTSGEAHARAVAEHGLLLALAGVRGVRAGSFARWDPDLLDVARVPSELSALIVGYGPVGRELAALLAPLFGQVRALSRRGRDGEPVEVLPFERAPEAFAAADLVVLAVPLSAESRQLLAPARFLAALRPDVILVNLARGELVDETALVAFLDAHPASRYLADVAAPEPYPDDLPLRRPQVLLTPHVAARRTDSWRRIGARALELCAAKLGALS